MSDIVDSIASRLITKAFAPRPVVRCEGSLLIIESGWRTSMLTLGGRSRRVSVDRKNEIIRIQDRRFWAFTNRQVISFDRIQEIIYNYSDALESDWVSHDARIYLELDCGSRTERTSFCSGSMDKVNLSITPFFRTG